MPGGGKGEEAAYTRTHFRATTSHRQLFAQLFDVDMTFMNANECAI
jgi:hypothetical protein